MAGSWLTPIFGAHFKLTNENVRFFSYAFLTRAPLGSGETHILLGGGGGGGGVSAPCYLPNH